MLEDEGTPTSPAFDAIEDKTTEEESPPDVLVIPYSNHIIATLFRKGYEIRKNKSAFLAVSCKRVRHRLFSKSDFDENIYLTDFEGGRGMRISVTTYSGRRVHPWSGCMYAIRLVQGRKSKT